MEALYSQVAMLERDLGNDDVAWNWFNFNTAPAFIPSTLPPSEAPPTPRPGAQMYFYLMLDLNKHRTATPKILKGCFQG